MGDVLYQHFGAAHDRGGMFEVCFPYPSRRSALAHVVVLYRWANQRKVFGKLLVSQAVIRAKLAQMIARVESAQHWLENITFQMDHMDYKQQSDKLAGQIAFLKMYATRTAQETAEDAVQVFGGRGITRTGMGRFIENVSPRSNFRAREVTFCVTPVSPYRALRCCSGRRCATLSILWVCHIG